MRKTLVLSAVLICALAAALSQAHVPESFAADEQAHLRAHFDSVERELRARSVPGLTPAQRAARARLLDLLRRYRLRGVFPRNTDFADRRMPTFIDYWGKRCGVAYLMEETGNEDMVLRIAATRNNARVPELKDDPEVVRWLAANGITLPEATRIQPDYRCGTIHGGPCPASAGYKVATGFVVATNVTASALTLLHTGLSPEASTFAALGAGTIGIVAGAPNMGQTGSRGTMGLLNVGAGSVSLALGLIRLTQSPASETRSRVKLAPWFGRRGATGLAASVAF